MKALRLHLVKVDKVLSELQRQLADVIHRLECGEDLDEAVVMDLMSRIRNGVVVMGQSDVCRLHEQVERAICLMTAVRDQAAAEIKQIRRGKAALSGYSHIRGYRDGQRLSRKA